MPEPVSIKVSGNVGGSIVVGDHNFVVNTNHGTIVYQQSKPQVQARQFAAQPPRAPRGFINRSAELAKLEGWIAANEIVLLHGPDGMGKSALLRQAANSTAGRAMPGGVIVIESVDVNGQALGPDDIIQRLFDALFEATPPLKVDAVSARTYLSNTRPLILMDEVGLAPALQQALPDLFPQGSILLAADAPFGADSQRLAVGPLPRGEALALLASRAELTLNDINRAALEKICELLGDVSLALVVTGNVLRETQTSPDAALQAIEAIATPERDPALAALSRAFGFAFSRLSPAEQQVLSAAALTPGVSMSPEWLSAALGSVDVSAVIERLKALGLLFTNSPRLRLPPGFAAPARRASVLSEQTVLPRLIEFLRNRSDIQDELGNLFGALTWAASAGRPADVIMLGRTLDSYLTLHGLWDGWQVALEYALDAARASGQQNIEAWALHQLGTRAIGVGTRQDALSLLNQALALRLKLGNVEGAAYTRHNINVLVPPPAPPKPKGPNWPALIGGTVFVGFFLLAALIIFGWQFINPPRTPTRTPTPAPVSESTLTVPPTLEATPTPTESPTPTPAATLTATSTPTPLGGGAGEMVFHSGNDNPYLIQRILIDGSNLLSIIPNAQQAVWSPDGQWIAYVARPAQDPNDLQIFLLNVAKGTVKAITATSGDKSHPAWSPEGKRIAFAGYDANFNRDIYVVDLGGGDPVQLMNTSEVYEDNPVWSPDGGQILYQANAVSYQQLFLINADGSSGGLGQVLPNPAALLRRDMLEPAWSPDGSQIAFATNPGSDRYDIYVMNLDGSGLRRLTGNKFAKSDERAPAWSPDGGWIAFTSTISGTNQIFIMSADGAETQTLITGDVAAWEPDWRP